MRFFVEMLTGITYVFSMIYQSLRCDHKNNAIITAESLLKLLDKEFGYISYGIKFAKELFPYLSGQDKLRYNFAEKVEVQF